MTHPSPDWWRGYQAGSGSRQGNNFVDGCLSCFVGLLFLKLLLVLGAVALKLALVLLGFSK